MPLGWAAAGAIGASLLGGGGDAPAAPDYASAAKETAEGNKEAAQFAVNANRINQYTPYGSLTYSRKQPTFNQAGYDAAMAKYNQAGQSQSPQSYTSTYDDATNSYIQTPIGGASGASAGTAPRREDFMLPDDGGGWEQRMELTPQAQATLDKQMALSDKYADVAGIGFDRARQIFENPQIDESLLPQRAIDIGKTAQEALLSRIEPNLLREDEALRTRLANQGIGLGSTAYGREMGLLGQKGTDLRLQAALQGINLDQANRAAALNEAYTKQSRPLDLINALRSGAQVQNPTFQGFAQQANAAGPDLLTAANQQYQTQMAGYNADQAANSSMLSGLMGLGGAALMSPAGTFTGAGGLFSKLSDIRTKENIKQVGKLDNGLNVYEYTYKPEFDIPGIHVGVMAQEVIKVKPEAIVMRDDGYMAVNYAMI
jgi:hypothetical protein